jgi:hypothetical protein
MYYVYKCPKCGHPIGTFEEEEDAAYDAPRTLLGLVKQHYQQYHEIDDIPHKDQDMIYEIQHQMTSSEERPAGM